MENYRKHLRDMSILVLVFAVIGCVRAILNVFMMDFNMEALPDGATAGIVLVSQIIMTVFMLIFAIPDFYIGVKGLKISKNPDSSKAHIVWATILAVLSGLSVLSYISSLTQGDIVNGLINVIGTALDVAIYVLYIICAKKVRQAA